MTKSEMRATTVAHIAALRTTLQALGGQNRFYQEAIWQLQYALRFLDQPDQIIPISQGGLFPEEASHEEEK